MDFCTRSGWRSSPQPGHQRTSCRTRNPSSCTWASARPPPLSPARSWCAPDELMNRFHNFLARQRQAAHAVEADGVTRYSARSTRTSWPLLIRAPSPCDTRAGCGRGPAAADSGGAGGSTDGQTGRLRALHRRRDRAVRASQPTTSRSPVAGPLIVVGGISCATRRTFSARILTMWSWLSGS